MEVRSLHNKELLVRTHPISIAAFLYRFLFLLLIPVGRGFITALTGGLLAWLRGAWIDLIVVAVILALAYAKWDQFKYHMDSSGIYFTIGIFFKRNSFIPMQKISTFSILRPFWFKPFHLVKVRIDTIAGDPGKADLSLYLRADEAGRLMRLHGAAHEQQASPGISAEYRPPVLGVVFLSLFTSNSVLGIVFVATFISQAGQILGEQLSELLFATFQELARQIAISLPLLTAGFLAIRLPPIAAGVAIALLGGWLVAFLLNLLQTKNLRVQRKNDRLRISGGILVEKDYSLRTGDISFVDIRQSLVTRTLRLYSVFVNAIGIGKDKSDIAAIIPFSTKSRAMRQLGLLLPEYCSTPRQLRPNGGAIFKFIIDPLWPCLLIPAATFLGIWLLPNWAEILRFAGFMLSLPAFWFLGVRLMDFFSSGVSRSGKHYTLRYSNLYYLHTVVFSYDKIALVNIRQSILQRGDNKCDLVVSTRAEGRMRHHIRNIGWDETVALFEAQDAWAPADAGIPNWYERIFQRALAVWNRRTAGRKDGSKR